MTTRKLRQSSAWNCFHQEALYGDLLFSSVSSLLSSGLASTAPASSELANWPQMRSSLFLLSSSLPGTTASTWTLSSKASGVDCSLQYLDPVVCWVVLGWTGEPAAGEEGGRLPDRAEEGGAALRHEENFVEELDNLTAGLQNR